MRSRETRPVKWRIRTGAWKLGATVLTVAGVALFAAGTAFADGQLTVTPNTDLTGGEVVAVDGTGLAADSSGYLVECNEASGEPTVTLGVPVDFTLPVGCTPPSLRHIVPTSADGTLSSSYPVTINKKVGPPCGAAAVWARCPKTDSAGKKPSIDAQDYSCPPPPAQQVAGVTCDLLFLDAAQDEIASAVIFAGGEPPLPTTTTTPPKKPKASTSTTVPKTTTTTRAATTATTRAVTTASQGTTPTTPTTAAVKTAASSSKLAFTGAGPPMTVLLLLGVVMTGLGLMMWLVVLWRRPQRLRVQGSGRRST